MAELRPGYSTELFLYFSATSLYLPGDVMKALDPTSLSQKCSRCFQLFFTLFLHFAQPFFSLVLASSHEGWICKLTCNPSLGILDFANPFAMSALGFSNLQTRKNTQPFFYIKQCFFLQTSVFFLQTCFSDS